MKPGSSSRSRSRDKNKAKSKTAKGSQVTKCKDSDGDEDPDVSEIVLSKPQIKNISVDGVLPGNTSIIFKSYKNVCYNR